MYQDEAWLALLRSLEKSTRIREVAYDPSMNHMERNGKLAPREVHGSHGSYEPLLDAFYVHKPPGLLDAEYNEIVQRLLELYIRNLLESFFEDENANLDSKGREILTNDHLAGRKHFRNLQRRNIKRIHKWIDEPRNETKQDWKTQLVIEVNLARLFELWLEYDGGRIIDRAISNASEEWKAKYLHDAIMDYLWKNDVRFSFSNRDPPRVPTRARPALQNLARERNSVGRYARDLLRSKKQRRF